uniref:Uncharacterized protein n=1 Tax=Raoultella planticola TaxID=575 RepID=W8CUI4_RAOPL|nr:hypothetical protein pKpNDM1_00280 [Raoultella planticola]
MNIDSIISHCLSDAFPQLLLHPFLIAWMKIGALRRRLNLYNKRLVKLLVDLT